MERASIRFLKKAGITLILPVLMYAAMYWLCHANGKDFFGTWTMWRSLFADIGLILSCALGIGLQFKCGRFDFSGGAIMLLAAIVAGNLASDMGSSPVLLMVLSIVICVVCSLLVALVYVYGRMPIVIVTIGMALLFESVTCFIYRGGGINLVGNSSLKIFSAFPMVFLPMLLSVAVYGFYSYCTTTGRRAELLSNNQQAAVNIGVNERRNIIISYVFSGLVFGFATTIYCSTGMLYGAFSSLQTVGALFSNILPVFIGITLAAACGDLIGIIVGSVSLSLLNFGLEAVYTAEMGSAISYLFTGAFLILFNFIAGQTHLFGKIGRALRARCRSNT